MRIVAVQTMQELDQRAIAEFGVPGLTLMENAGRACVEEIVAESGPARGKRAVIIAGKGNNGGDGYVIARLLSQQGWAVKVCVLAEAVQIGGDAAVNLGRLPPDLVVFCPQAGQIAAVLSDDLARADVIVDAMLGTGLNSDIAGVYREAALLVNAAGRPVLAVDIPSGIHGDTGRVMGEAVRASVTVTFAFAKPGHILYPGAEQTGRLVIADIGIPPQLMERAACHDFLDADEIRPLLRRRDRQAHKGHFGHCLIIAGSSGKSGAAALAANSAVRAGSGLVTLAVPRGLNPILEVKTTEAMTAALPDSGNGRLAENAFAAVERLLPGKDALAIGPGLGLAAGTAALVRTLLETVELPLVVDADGLNALAGDVGLLRRKRSVAMVLTPHPGEMARLLGVSVPEVEAERIPLARDFARNHGVYLVLKGARTIIAEPSGLTAINGSGNPGMASGGMGDVLTGIICSLLGQGYPPWDACRLGVFIHGYAADLVAGDKGEIGINATDVQEMLPYAYRKLAAGFNHTRRHTTCRP
ncbi:MAG: NAD(P)H-hydrate dehydratase [Deltaproteobacteria bacterium]|nr:NAD(P)H-hydrate dehydratase [Deltaproteobacteria bacterium]